MFNHQNDRKQREADALFRANQPRGYRSRTSSKLGLFNQGKYNGIMHQRKVAKYLAMTIEELSTA